MRRARIALAALALLASASVSFAQGVTLLQAGPTTSGHVPMYYGQGQSQPVVQDSGPAAGGNPGVGLSEIGITARGTGAAPYAGLGTGPYGTIDCRYDGPTNSAAGYHYLCLSPNAQGGGLLAFGNGGAASPLPLYFIVNGSKYSFPYTVGGVVGPVSSTIGHIAVWNNTSGSLLADGGVLTFSNISGLLGCNQLPAFTGAITNSGCALTIGPGVVTAAMLASGAAASNIGTLGGDLAGSTLPNPTIAAGAVTSAKIAAATILSANVAANTLTYSQQAQAAANTVVGNPTGSSANKQDMAMPSCSGAQQFLQWLSGSGFQCSSVSGSSTPTSPVRQTVAGGPVQTGTWPGAPSVFPASSVSLSLTTQNVSSSYPLVVTAANGFGAAGPVDTIGESTSNITWSALAGSSTLYLYVTVNSNGTLSPGFTSLAPIYEWGGSPATTNGQFTFNIGEMRGYMGNGSTAPQANIVFVGQVVTNSSTVTSTIAYAYNGQIDTVVTALGPLGSGTAIINHDLGCLPERIDLVLVNVTANAGYTTGQQAKGASVSNGTYVIPTNGQITSTLFNWAFNNNGMIVINPSTGAFTSVTQADWNFFFHVARGWGGA